MMTTKKGEGGLDHRAPEPTAVDDSEIRAAMVAAGDLDNSDERLPAQHAMIGTS